MKKTLLCLLSVLPMSGFADVTLPKVITSNMVLQRDVPIVIWGWADAGEEVTVTLGTSTDRSSATAKTNTDGSWKVTLAKRGLGKALHMTVQGQNRIELENILMGDVWLCSGQSNMERAITQLPDYKKVAATANYPTIRLFDVGKLLAKTPMKDIAIGSGWETCSPENILNIGTGKGFSGKGFSSVAYYFAINLQEKMPDVPIGLIDSSWGGSKIEPWTSPAGWESVPELAKEYAVVKQMTGKKMRLNQRSKIPCTYNSMVHGLASLAIKGTLWYQGESNRAEGMHYHFRKLALINGWRQIWGEKMPFYFVQLAPFSYPQDKNPELLPVFWQAQQKSAEEIPYTGMAVTIDVGNPKDIHPLDKEPVGKRLALLALKHTYGKDIVADSPSYLSHHAERSGMSVMFKNIGSGLVSSDGKALRGFQLAGADGEFIPAQAKIINQDTVLVSNPKLAKPLQVRYAWSNTPDVNLASKEGLPAPAFNSK